MKRLELLSPDLISTTPDKIKGNNAFILPNGSFYLAKGYTGCNPSHQLESSALAIARQEFDYDVKKDYNDKVEEQLKIAKELGPAVKVFRQYDSVDSKDISFTLDENGYIKKYITKPLEAREIIQHYYLSTILVHYYGYTLFARYQDMHRQDVFYEVSLIPFPDYYGHQATSEQIETLEQLFKLNDANEKCSQENLKRVLHHQHVGRWRF